MSKITACDREWKSRRDDDGSIHLELWDNFLSNLVKQGPVDAPGRMTAVVVWLAPGRALGRHMVATTP